MLITIKHQAELEGRHSQARAWERDNSDRKNLWRLTSLMSPLIFISLYFVVGCDMYDQIINEMESAYIIVDKEKNSTFIEREVSVSCAVKKFFPIGMKKEDVLIALNILNNNGFEITELNNRLVATL